MPDTKLIRFDPAQNKSDRLKAECAVKNKPYKGLNLFFFCGKIDYVYQEKAQIEERDNTKDFMMKCH
jgi:hypothetical protein